LASYDASDVRSWPFCDIGRERLDVGSQIKSGHPTAIAMLLTVAPFGYLRRLDSKTQHGSLIVGRDEIMVR
jgi:hypothetical protein